MNKTIHKFPLKVDKTQEITIPQEYRVMGLQMQSETPCLWLMLDPKADTFQYTVHMFGTGWPIPDYLNLEHIGTVQQETFVWHYFIETP